MTDFFLHTATTGVLNYSLLTAIVCFTLPSFCKDTNMIIGWHSYGKKSRLAVSSRSDSLLKPMLTYTPGLFMLARWAAKVCGRFSQRFYAKIYTLGSSPLQHGTKSKLVDVLAKSSSPTDISRALKQLIRRLPALWSIVGLTMFLNSGNFWV